MIDEDGEVRVLLNLGYLSDAGTPIHQYLIELCYDSYSLTEYHLGDSERIVRGTVLTQGDLTGGLFSKVLFACFGRSSASSALKSTATIILFLISLVASLRFELAMYGILFL